MRIPLPYCLLSPFSVDSLTVHVYSFTGLALRGQAKFSAWPESPMLVLYEFAPLGRALVGWVQLMAWAGAVEERVTEPRYDLAGLCRAAAVRGQEPFHVTQDVYSHPPPGLPTTDEKATHLLQLLYEGGSHQHEAVDLVIGQDFPLGFAHSAREFHRLLEHLIAEDLVRFDQPDDSPNDWVDELRTNYYGVLLTPAGKQRARQLLRVAAPPTGPEPPAPAAPLLPAGNLAALHPQLREVVGSLFASGHYRQAVLEGYIALIQAVKQKAGRPDLDGSALMDTVFSHRTPVLRVADDPNEQQGFMPLFKGAVLGDRNPKAHAITGQLDGQRALEWLGFASVLFRKLEEAQLTSSSPGT